MSLYIRFKLLILAIITRYVSKKETLVRDNVGLSKAETIGVLYCYETPAKHETVQRFIRALKNLDKKVNVLCYTTPKDCMHPSSNLLYSFGHEAITLLGSINSDRVQKFIDTSFDYLFHADIVSNPTLDYIVAKSQSKCRVGCFDRLRKHLFEVMVKVQATEQPLEDTKRLTSFMLHYTSRMER